jgi:hypothetical protein
MVGDYLSCYSEPTGTRSSRVLAKVGESTSNSNKPEKTDRNKPDLSIVPFESCCCSVVSRTTCRDEAAQVRERQNRTLVQ